MAMAPALALTAMLAQGGAPSERVTTLTGHIEHLPGFHSELLGNTRNLIVYLPPQYDKQPKRRFPVLYLHDGQNVFDGMTSFLPNKEWRLDETAEALIDAGLIEPIIMVGIDNGGAERANEYLPTRFKPSPESEPIGGKADRYGRMILEEIKPMIDRKYRTKPDAANTGLMGSSFGGIATLYLGLKHSDKFGRLGVVSPSLWVDDQIMPRQIEALPGKLPLRIWIDMGGSEGGDPKSCAEAVASARHVGELLTERGWKPGKDLAVYIEGFAVHNEDAWARRSPAILMFLFGTKPNRATSYERRATSRVD